MNESTGVETVRELKHALQKITNVPVASQKLLGLKPKPQSGGINDDTKLESIDIKPTTRIIMMGQPQEALDKANEKPDVGEVIDDFDIDNAVVPLKEREEFVAKIEKRVKNYEIKVLNEPREGKNLLVLDIDYTIYDHKSSADRIEELTRPFLHEFLARVYPLYDIVIWSATSMKWIEAKMKEMGLIGREDFKLCFYLDSAAMISIHTENHGLTDAKPLAVIWGKFPDKYSPKNTIMFDDVRHNFLMNPENGLKIRPFREAHSNRNSDRELISLGDFLIAIAANESDFTRLDLKKWHKYKKNV